MSLVAFQVAAFLGAVGQLLFKRSVTDSRSAMIAAVTLYVAVLGLFVFAYRLGGAVSVLYPSYASTFVWGLVLARLYSGERITWAKLIGTSCVIGGIVLVTI